MLSRLISFVLLVVFLAAQVAPAWAAGEPVIVDILALGNERVETATILNAVKSRKGEPVNAERVDADVRAIFGLGQFLDANAATEETTGGVNLVFNLVEKPIVRDIKILGNKEISTEKVREVLEVKTSTAYNPPDLARSVKKIKKLYADDGYYLAEVNASAEKLSQTEVVAAFTIKEGEKVLIKSITFTGNKAYTPKQILKVMETKEKWWLSWLTGAGTYKEEVLKNDVNLITELYMNNGYANVKVGEPKVKLLDDKSGLTVTIGISEGDQFRVGQLDFKGDQPDDLPQLKMKLQTKSGEIFSRAKLRSDIFTFTDSFGDKGYAFANISPLTRMNPAAKTIDVTFDMEKGEKIYVDRINITGNSKTRDKVVRREMRLYEGQLTSSTGLKRSKQNLMNLGFFEEANITNAAGSDDKKMNINVEVKEKPTGTFSFGAGYSSVDGLVGQGSVSQSNFLGLGLKGNLAASLGGRSQTYNLGIQDPYFLDTRWTLGGDIYRTEREYTNYNRRATGGDIKAGYALSDEVSTFWIYKLEYKDISNLQNIDPSVTIETNGSTSSILGSISRNTTDYRPEPTRGMSSNLSVEFAGLGGTNRFLRYQADTIVFTPLLWSLVGSVKGTLGYIQDIGKPLFIDEMYYIGGINTVRGYNSRTISPYTTIPVVDPQLGVITGTDYLYLGGNKEAILNVEITFPLVKDAGLKGVIFYDAGNAYGENQKMFSGFQTSYGAGVRWMSPMGPLRLEYGIPINPRPGIDNTGGKLEFSMGSFF